MMINCVKNLKINSVLSELTSQKITVETTDSVSYVLQLFEKEKTIPGIVVLVNGRLSGLLSRKKFFEVMSKQFMYDLYSKRNVEFFITSVNLGDPLLVTASTPIITAVNLALQRPGSDIIEPIVVDFGNSIFRILDFYKLLSAQNEIQVLMNDMLKRANDFKQEVLTIVSHDLRNPLNAIMGFSELIRNQPEDVLQSKEFATYINNTASQMGDLLNDFLSSALNDSTEYKPTLLWFDIHVLLRSVISNFESSAREKSQTIIFESNLDDYQIFSDKVRIREVFENLISNAVKYSYREREIIIRLYKSGTSYIFEVKDHGPGFSNEDQTKIYGKFQRLSAKPSANESSTGLGLFITRQIIEKLNGRIELETLIGCGSTFRVYLPETTPNPVSTKDYLKSEDIYYK